MGLVIRVEAENTYGKTTRREMKIRVESEKIVKAVKKLDGIEIVLENAVDAEEALNLVLSKTGLLEGDHSGKLRIKVTSLQQYETSAVDYKMMFLLEFLFDDDIPLDSRVSMIKTLQEFFKNV